MSEQRVPGEAGGLQGQVLGQWVLGDCLGKGGMSVVHKATHLETGQTAAIKILKFSEDVPGGMTDRFFHELHISRRLKHPHIIDVYEFGFEQQAGFYLAMEQLHGCNLYDYMLGAAGDLPYLQVYEIVSQICDAMEFAHQRGIVHRDLKPENIYLCGGPDRVNELKVLDFGIAKFQLGESNRLTQSGTTLGTPHYLSPEQAMGESVGAASDIYSLSVILFELLTGEQLFVADSPLQYMMRHAYTEPPKLSQARTDKHFSPALEELVLRGLEKQPETRIASMSQFKKSLYECITGSLSERTTSEMSSFVPQVGSVGSYHIDAAPQREAIPPKIRPIQIGGEKKPKSVPKLTPKPAPKKSSPPQIISKKMDEKKKVAPKSRMPKKKSRPLPLWKNPLVVGVFLLFTVGIGGAAAFQSARSHLNITDQEQFAAKQAWKQLQDLPIGAKKKAFLSAPTSQAKKKRQPSHLPLPTHSEKMNEPSQNEPSQNEPSQDGVGPDIHDGGTQKRSKWMNLIQQKLGKKKGEIKKENHHHLVVPLKSHQVRRIVPPKKRNIDD